MDLTSHAVVASRTTCKDSVVVDTYLNCLCVTKIAYVFSAAGGKVDLDLAVASTLGSGLFISCVMTASVVLIKTVDIVDTVAYVRDIVAYIAANLLVLFFVLDGKLEVYEAVLLILLYVVYVAIACYSSK